MTKITLALFTVFFSLTSSAQSQTKYLTDKYMANINLQGLQIFTQGGEDEFIYQIRPIENLDKGLADRLVMKSKSEIVSQVYELNQKLFLKNIYLYVGSSLSPNPNVKYSLVVLYGDSLNVMNVVNYDIKSANPDTLYLENGLPHDRYQYKAQLKVGTFFPAN